MDALIEGLLVPCGWVSSVFDRLPITVHGSGMMGRLTLIPINEDLREELGADGTSTSDAFHALSETLQAFLVEASACCPVGYMESRLGSDGIEQAAAVWHRRELVMAPTRGSTGVIRSAARYIEHLMDAPGD